MTPLGLAASLPELGSLAVNLPHGVSQLAMPDLIRQANLLVDRNQYGAVLRLTNDGLQQLGVDHLPPERVARLGQLAVLRDALGPDPAAVSLYAEIARVRGAMWHGLGAVEDFARAVGLYQMALSLLEPTLEHGSRSRPIADIYHYWGKSLIELAAREEIEHLADWEWRVMRPRAGTVVQAAIAALERERAVRPLDDALGFSHSWRVTARALQMAGVDRAAERRLAFQRAGGYLGEVNRRADSHLFGVAFRLDQARTALVTDDSLSLRPPLDVTRTSVEIAFAQQRWGEVCLALGVLADLQAATGADLEFARAAALAALFTWQSPQESRDSRKVLTLLRHLDVTERDIRQFIERPDGWPIALDQTPGSDLDQRVETVIARLRGSRPADSSG